MIITILLMPLGHISFTNHQDEYFIEKGPWVNHHEKQAIWVKPPG
jgi:hypothetical protein